VIVAAAAAAFRDHVAPCMILRACFAFCVTCFRHFFHTARAAARSCPNTCDAATAATSTRWSHLATRSIPQRQPRPGRH
jgi:hypothetical protein